MNRATVGHIQDAYSSSTEPWFLGFSGGKDSSCLAVLLYRALRGLKSAQKPVRILYVDTGVDIPVMSAHATSVLRALKRQARIDELPIDISIARPRIGDRFFVKVLGRGYVTPTNKFRWCTDRLRINPVRRLLDAATTGGYVVLLGTRKGESVERDRTLVRHQSQKPYYFRQSSNARATIYSPILEYSTKDVWATLVSSRHATFINTERLRSLYQSASGECPTIRDPKGTPCGNGRFGCWTCTVVRQDKAMQGLISSGHDDLYPLLVFRDWLSQIRDDPKLRCKRRRNGQKGPGPFTLEARQLILKSLLETQKLVPWSLISDKEVSAIRALWRADRQSHSYREY